MEHFNLFGWYGVLILLMYLWNLSSVEACGDATSAPCIIEKPDSFYNVGCFDFSVTKYEYLFQNTDSSTFFQPPYFLYLYSSEMTAAWFSSLQTLQQQSNNPFESLLTNYEGYDQVKGAFFNWHVFKMLAQLYDLWVNLYGSVVGIEYVGYPTTIELYRNFLPQAIFETMANISDSRSRQQTKLNGYFERVMVYLLGEVDAASSSFDPFQNDPLFTSHFSFLSPVDIDFKRYPAPAHVDGELINSLDIEETINLAWDIIYYESIANQGLAITTLNILNPHDTSGFTEFYSMCPNLNLIQQQSELDFILSDLHTKVEEIAKYWLAVNQGGSSTNIGHSTTTHSSTKNTTNITPRTTTVHTTLKEETTQSTSLPTTMQTSVNQESTQRSTHTTSLHTTTVRTSSLKTTTASPITLCEPLQVPGNPFPTETYTFNVVDNKPSVSPSQELNMIFPQLIQTESNIGSQKWDTFMESQTQDFQSVFSDIVASADGQSLLTEFIFRVRYFELLFDLSECVKLLGCYPPADSTGSFFLTKEQATQQFRDLGSAAVIFAYVDDSKSFALNEYLDLISAYLFNFDFSQTETIQAFRIKDEIDRMPFLSPIRDTTDLPEYFNGYVDEATLRSFDLETLLQEISLVLSDPFVHFGLPLFSSTCSEVQGVLVSCSYVVNEPSPTSEIDFIIPSFLDEIREGLQQVANYWAVVKSMQPNSPHDSSSVPCSLEVQSTSSASNNNEDDSIVTGKDETKDLVTTNDPVVSVRNDSSNDNSNNPDNTNSVTNKPSGDSSLTTPTSTKEYSSEQSSTNDEEVFTESTSRLPSTIPSSLAPTSDTVSTGKQKSTKQMTSSVRPLTTQATSMEPSTTQATSMQPSSTEVTSMRPSTTEVTSVQPSTSKAASMESTTTEATSPQMSKTRESLKTTTEVESTSDSMASTTQDVTMESTADGVTGSGTTGAGNKDNDVVSSTTMETEDTTEPGHSTTVVSTDDADDNDHTDSPDHTDDGTGGNDETDNPDETDEETESTPTEETGGNDERTEDDQNNQDDPTEGTPETKEYRASELLNDDTMKLVINGNEGEKQVSLDFHSENGDFDGVKKEDFTFTFENVKSYKNGANIRASVRAVSASNFGIDVYVDSSASFNLMMAVKGTTVQDSFTENPLSISLKVKHSAPICNRRRFTDTGNAIEFGFDVPVNVTRTADGGCADFFQDTNGLGDGATCDMKTPRLLVVTIGSGSNLIEPGGTLTFKTDAIKPARQLFYTTLNNGYVIEGPDNPPRPSFTIAGPVRINRCGTYKLRAEQITGHGGRPINYRWQLQTEVEDGSGLNSNFFSGLNEGRGSPVLQLDAADLQPGQQYDFALEITNFLGQGAQQDHTLSVINDIKPVLEIKPINVIPGRVRVSSRVKLEAVVTFSFGDDCESTINAPTYEWSGPDGLIPVDRSDDRVLVLPPNTLPVNEDTEITVTVTQGSSSTAITTVTETITLTTIASPLVAHINGASKLTLGPQDTVELDGSRSHDPDETGSQDLTYEWTCLSKADSQPCDNRLGDELTTSKVLVQGSQFDAGTYDITLTVTKGARMATAAVTVIVAVETVPTIRIKTRSGRIKFRDDENVYIQANINSGSVVTIDWSELNDRFDPALWEFGETFNVPDSTEYRTHVKIPSDQTTAGSQYTVEVIATDQNGKSGVAALDFSIYQPITQCEVEASPYIEMKEITITATGCVGDPDLQPLTYQPVFAVRLEDGYKKIVLGRQQGASSQTVIATPIEYNGETVTVGFEVCDANSTTCVNAFTTTTYTSTAVLSDTEREQFIAEKIDKQLEAGDVVSAFSNSINIANMQKKQLQAERRKKRDQFSQFATVYGGDIDSLFLVVEQIDFTENMVIKSQFDEVGSKQVEVLEKVGPTDGSEGAAILGFTSVMLQSTFTEDEIDKTLQAVDRIFETSKEEGYRHSQETMERTLTTLASSSNNLKDTSTGEKKTELRQKIRDLRKAGLKQIGQDLTIGDHVTLTISGTKVSVVCFLPERDTAIDEGADLPVKIRPGGSISDRYLYDWCTVEGGDVCSGLKGLVFPVPELEEEITNCSNLTDVTLINPVTDEDVPVADLDDPIEIEMPTTQLEDGQTCVCKYWNEDTSQLESEGVTSETTADGKLICKSVHLTAFVGEVTYDSGHTQGPSPTMQGGTKTPSNGQLGLILGIVFGILGVILLVIIVGAVIFKVTQQKKVTPDGE